MRLEQVGAAEGHGYSEAEWNARVELAACYHVFEMFGWVELIYNHITVKVPGTEDEFLINPFGLTYDEVTPGNLLRINLAGEKLEDSPYPVNPAGFVIHSAIHGARKDAKCVAHTHTTAGLAIASTVGGLEMSNFYAAQLYGEIAYHDFEGISDDPEECGRMVQALGDRPALILRNHGLLSCGETVAEAFYTLWRLERSCQIQMATAAIGKPLMIADAVCEKSTAQIKTFDPEGQGAQRIFDAMRRRAARSRPDLDWLAA